MKPKTPESVLRAMRNYNARRKGYVACINPRPRPTDSRCQCCFEVALLVPDHDHFRGWICKTCNIGIGMLGGTTESVERALRYLSGAWRDP